MFKFVLSLAVSDTFFGEYINAQYLRFMGILFQIYCVRANGGHDIVALNSKRISKKQK